MTTITKKMLRGACKKQKAIFVQEWPKGAEATIENVQRAVELGLDLSWGTRLFTPEAKAEYERQRTPIREAYHRQIAPLYKDYQHQFAMRREAYERQIDPLYKDYQRQIAPLWLEAFMASNRRET